MKFVDPRNDVAFKKIFGSDEHTEVLISFLNAVLDLHDDRQIEHVHILNPYQTPRIETLKYTLLDVRARDRRGITFIVEMQVAYVLNFEKRFLYYTSKAYVNQIERGEDYPRLNQVIFIGILDFTAFTSQHYLTRHLILNTENGQQDLGDLEFNFIELPKFTTPEEELETVLEKWLYFIKHASNLEVIPSSVQEPPLRTAYEIADRFRWSKDDLEAYENRGIKIQDERGAIQAAEVRGEARGRAQGVEEGRQQGQHDTARRMLADGMPPATVAKYTGLSLEDIEKLIIVAG
jgi:predicted transposase/invertase (TIGR01784 family)